MEHRLRHSMIVVPGPAECAVLDALRRRFDPHVDLVPPHITVAFPDVPVRGIDPGATFDALVTGLAPFRVRLSVPRGPAWFDGALAPKLAFLVRRYPNARGWVVAVAEEGADALLGLRRGAARAIPQPPELLDFPPYLTLGQSLEDREAALALRDASAGFDGLTFEVRELELAREGTDGRWSTVHRSPLRGADSPR